MNHQDHVRLIKKGITKQSGMWADFGSGEGAFTLALRELLGPHAKIYSIDRDATSLMRQQRLFKQQFPASNINFITADFTKTLELPPLDGMIMANSLHFIADQLTILKMVNSYLKDEGTLILVEYNAERGNYWVPHPISPNKFRTLALQSNFAEPEIIGRVPSHFLNEIYAAVVKKLAKS